MNRVDAKTAEVERHFESLGIDLDPDDEAASGSNAAKRIPGQQDGMTKSINEGYSVLEGPKAFDRSCAARAL